MGSIIIRIPPWSPNATLTGNFPFEPSFSAQSYIERSIGSRLTSPEGPASDVCYNGLVVLP